MGKTPQERFAEHIEAELNRERAAVLGRYGARVEAALSRCRSLDDELGPAPSPAALAEYRRARREALDAIDAFCFQRECLGLLDPRWVDRIYPRPPAR